MEVSLSKEQIIALFTELDRRLNVRAIKGEIYLVGGAVMCLAFNARPSTKDVDALFKPTKEIRQLAAEIAKDENLRSDWLNDGVKGFLSARSDFQPYLELPNLKIYVAIPEFLLAMKCLSFRIGAEFSDEEDVRFLLRYLNIERYEDALKIITRYYSEDMFPQKTFYALEELLSKRPLRP